MKQTILSAKQSELLEDLIVKHGRIVTSAQILAQAERYWDYKQAKNLVTRLVKNGWLVRIKRGFYAVSDLSTRGFLAVSPYVIANLLVSESYVSFESALAYHGMFDQLTNKTISIALKAFKPVEIADFEYRFVKTKPELFFGWQDIYIDGGAARLATPEKALIDSVHFHRSSYSIDLVIEKLIEHKDGLDLQRLIENLYKFPATTIKIFGLIFDMLKLNSEPIYEMVGSNKTTHFMMADSKMFNAKWRLYYDGYFDKYTEI